MDIKRARSRFRELDPQVVDLLSAVSLTVLVCVQIWLVMHIEAPPMAVPPGGHQFRPRVDYGVLPYLISACVFMPLAMRRSVPWLALVLTGLAAITYQFMPFPPAFTVMGPMIALYSFAAYAKRRGTTLMALGIAVLIVAVPAFAFSGGVRWVAQAVGSFMLLTAAAFLGDTARNRRRYIAEVERRAVEAERTREEEARRRVDEERMRIAREVHDIVAHSLSIVTVQAAAAEAVVRTDPDQAEESIRNIRTTGREALQELRSMLDVLRTGDGDLPLAPAADLMALEQLIGPVREAGIGVDLSVSGDPATVPAYASVSAYRIVQEALTNVVRHANANQVAVTISIGGGTVTVMVEDDGRGARASDYASGGHGVRGMRERVDALGGSFEIGSATSGGVRVAATIPLSRSGA